MNLFQSQIWAEFQKPSFLIDGHVFVKHPLPFGLSWLECPMGPIIQTTEEFEKLLQQLKPILKKEKIVFLRINPPILKSDFKNAQQLFAKDFKKTKDSHFPQATIILDLTKTEDELLAQMKPKGRYNIKVAQKHGVRIREVQPDELPEALPIFHEILKKTSSRDGFHIHPLSHYEKMLRVLGPQHAKLFFAEHAENEDKTTPIAGLIATYYGDTALYYYGASLHEYRHLMAPYLLQWEVMRDAKKHGYKKYDLFGIAPTREAKRSTPLNQTVCEANTEHDKNHPWSGVTDFKKKFGGEIIEYIQAREKVFKKFWYFVYKITKKIKKFL